MRIHDNKHLLLFDSIEKIMIESAKTLEIFWSSMLLHVKNWAKMSWRLVAWSVDIAMIFMRLLSMKEIADLISIESKVDSLRRNAVVDAQRDIRRATMMFD